MSLTGVADAGAGRKPGREPSSTTAARGNQQRPSKPPGAGLERGRTLTGRVLGDDGQPLADASVTAVPVGASSSSSLGILNHRSALTDESGKFVIEDLRSGAYKLNTFVPGFVASAGSSPVYYRPGDSATINLVKGGVITGVVTTSTGDPVVGIRVRAMLVRETNGRPARVRSTSIATLFQDWKTDDRGIYRIFGLDPGSYVVAAGGRGLMNFTSEGYDSDAPTYYPSATRDTALEVKVQASNETTGVDLQFRGGRGHAISGVIVGTIKGNLARAGVAVLLTHAGTGTLASFSPVLESSLSFQLNGVLDGPYDLFAMSGYGGGGDGSSEDAMASRSRRVEVKGSDVTGVELSLAPLGSVGGRVVLEKASGADPKACLPGSKALIEDTVIRMRPEGKGGGGIAFSLAFGASPSELGLDGMPDEKGEFKIRPLEAGRYRVELDLPEKAWFVRAMTLPGQKTQPVDAARGGIPLKAGEQLGGLTISVAHGAAAINGRVTTAKKGESPPSRLRLHLLPAEKEAADDVLRFFETAVDKDQTFSVRHIAPGRYLLLAKELKDDEVEDGNPVPAAWNSESRTKLRREAEAANVVLEFLPCQSVKDYVLHYKPPAPPTPRAGTQ